MSTVYRNIQTQEHLCSRYVMKNTAEVGVNPEVHLDPAYCKSCRSNTNAGRNSRNHLARSCRRVLARKQYDGANAQCLQKLFFFIKKKGRPVSGNFWSDETVHGVIFRWKRSQIISRKNMLKARICWKILLSG